MFGMPACVRPYQDGGKRCTDGSECEGDCIQEEPWVSAGTKTTGVCEVTDEPCGCRSLVVAVPCFGGLMRGLAQWAARLTMRWSGP